MEIHEPRRAGKGQFRPSEAQSAITTADLSRFSFPETANSQVVLVNGQFRQDLSSTAELESIVAVDLFSAIADARYNKIVRSYLARNANYHDKSMTALNTAFLQSGVFILIPKDTKLEVPVQISFVADSFEPNIAVFPRVLVVAEENSSAKLIESFVALKDGTYFSNAVVEVVVKQGARVEHCFTTTSTTGVAKVCPIFQSHKLESAWLNCFPRPPRAHKENSNIWLGRNSATKLNVHRHFELRILWN